jgi:hypothetical protein
MSLISSVGVVVSEFEIAVTDKFGFVEADEQEGTARDFYLHRVRHDGSIVNGWPESHLDRKGR